MDGILVFDGQCGMCTRVVNRMARGNRTGRLRIRLPESAWWLDASGAVFAGAHAMNAAPSKALGTPLPLGSIDSPESARCKTSSTAGWRHTDIAFAV
jgi:hypothetical protein